MPPKATEYRKEVGARLRMAREALGMNQGEIAAILSMNPNAVSMIEAGQRGLDPGKAIRLKKARGVSLDFLYSGDASNLNKDLFRELLKVIGGPAPKAPKREVA